jgi:hypothetical protein
MFPLPLSNAASMSMLQAKVAPDVQGRVFAALGQMSMAMLPFAFLLAGPLADNVFEPAVGQPGWETFAPLVGSSVGSGMGLLLVFGGVLTAILTLAVYSIPAVRHLERDLPDYVPDNQAAVVEENREVGMPIAVME